MTIPAPPHSTGVTLEWIMTCYSQADRRHITSAVSLLGSYRYLLSADITSQEAVNRLRCLRREYQTQPRPAVAEMEKETT
jgi:hypothetical protein